MAAKKSSLETADVLIAALQLFPGNPKAHDIDFLRESLREHGQFRAIVVRKSDMKILAGHGTVTAAREEGWEKVTAHLIECDDEKARKINLADNRANERGTWDEPALVAFLGELDDLDATGFATADMERLSARMEPPPPDPRNAVEPTFEIIVTCADKEAQDDLLDELARKGLECRALL